MLASKAKSSDDDSDVHGTYHFLDVGGLKYGECTLVRFGELAVLIDGSHEKDFEGQDGYDSIPDQLTAIFGHEPPFEISLVVVTHCHADHVGCLPDLIDNDIIRVKWALVTDPLLGFGRTSGDGDPVDFADARTLALAAALREEDATDLSDAELQGFIDVAATVESRYGGMMQSLETKGVKTIRYEGVALEADLVELLRPTGMTLIGPSSAQLRFCADQIGKTNKDATDAVDDALQEDANLDDVALYRRIAGAMDAADAFRNPRGSGMNCQSITLAFGPASARVLLAGDMQFSEPGVRGAAAEVANLRRAVAAQGPYRLFKTTHHTSHNGLDENLLAELGQPQIIVHSGGLRDASHPFPDTLELLKTHRRKLKFARTDRNGHITVRPHLPTDAAIAIAKGRLNDFTDNVTDEGAGTQVQASTALAANVAGSDDLRSPQVIIVNLPNRSVEMRVGNVDIIVRGPATGSARTVSSSVTLNDRGRAPRVATSQAAASSIALAGDRELPKLLFATHSGRLGANVGAQVAAATVAAIASKGHVVVDLLQSTGDRFAAVRAALQRNPDVRGVVIAGGYDVVPSLAVDVLGNALRAELGSEAARDHDNFTVWCDEAYGDVDGDRIAELPVSRIPDARSTQLFLNALQTRGPRGSRGFGVRNVARPFADRVWASFTQAPSLNVCETYLSQHITAEEIASAFHYFMLHGSNEDARVFSGEFTAKAGYPPGLQIDKVPAGFSGVVFSGCCWGGLVVSEKALEASGGPGSPRVAERSIALTYLKSGASAFVGCTGAHYSGPDVDPEANYAAILHGAFWQALPIAKFAAAQALFEARNVYGKWLSQYAASLEPIDIARRLKNRAQFTCLGLGW